MTIEHSLLPPDAFAEYQNGGQASAISPPPFYTGCTGFSTSSRRSRELIDTHTPISP